MRKAVQIIILSALFLIFPSITFAFTSQTRANLSFDETLSDQSAKQYTQPAKIYINQIRTGIDQYGYNSKEWIQSLYYFSLTRLGYLDIPYTYIIDREGKIYEGRNGGASVDPETIKKDGAIVLGYLSNDAEVTFSASQAFRQLITELSYSFGIERNDITMADITITKEGETSKSTFVTSNGEFAQNMAPTLSTCVYYKTEHIKYAAEIKDIVYPATVKSTEKFTVTFKLVNKNTYPWFSTKDYIYISTSNFRDSKFAVNGVWESFSKPFAIQDRVIMPGEELEVKFDMQAILLPGKYSERFVVTKLPKNIFTNSDIPVSVTVTKGDYDLVKVVNIPTLNVRDCAGPNCKIISQVGENQVLIMMEKSIGWYKVKYSGNKVGWVYGKYIQEL